MFGFNKNKRVKRGYDKSKMISNYIKVAIFQKFFIPKKKDDNSEQYNFEMAVLGQAINWLVPDDEYDMDILLKEADHEKKFKVKLIRNKEMIYRIAENILKSDPELEKLIALNLLDKGLLLNLLYPNGQVMSFPGFSRIQEFLENTKVKLPKEAWDQDEYRAQFEKFVNNYKVKIDEKNIEFLFSA